MPLRVIFMGTPDFAVPTLAAIAGAGHEIAAVYTQPPRPAGRRGLDLAPSPMARAAGALGLTVRTPATLKGAAEQQAFRALRADLAFVVAYGLILPKPVLDAPRLGCLNAHASLLPRWRGAAPIQRAIMAGDGVTGVSIMRMEEGLDTGPVALERRIAIDLFTTAGELHDRLAAISAELAVEALAKLERNELRFAPQPAEGATYAAKIDKAETRIDWKKPAREVHNHVRGLSPFPGAWCEMEIVGKIERVKVLRAAPIAGSGAPGTVLDQGLSIACGSGAVKLQELQRAGGKPLAADEFQRGARIAAGTVLP